MVHVWCMYGACMVHFDDFVWCKSFAVLVLFLIWNFFFVCLLFPFPSLDNLASKRPTKRPSQKPIEQLTKNKLDSYHADLWVMSPPCQPYTRQRVNQPISKKDVNDRRAASFTHLTFILPTLINPPQYILLENVVGFETSISCRQWLQTLQQCQYNVNMLST